MENVAHTLTGVALARAGLGRTSPLATTALVIGSNLPDIDLLWSLRGDLAYLHFHRGWTHSILGGIVWTVVLWAGLLGFGRWRARGGAPPAAGALFLAAAAGVGSHILLDASNPYGLRPFLPWDGRWIYGDLWHIVDPWLWMILGTAVFLSGDGGRRRTGAWIAAASAITLVLVVLPIPLVAPGTRVAWTAGLALAVVLARRGPEGRAPRVALAVVAAYAAACAILHGAALARLDAATPRDIVQRAAIPRFGDPMHWDGLAADRDAIHYRIVSAVAALDSSDRPVEVFARNLDDPIVREILDSCTGAVILDFFRFPFAVIDVARPGGGRVALRDARYSRSSDAFAAVTVPLTAGLPDPGSLDCP